MKRGGKFFGSAAVLALAACGTQPGLQIRTTAAPLSAQQKPVPIRIAEARAQFALGNVALALESFRKAVREDPSSTDAMLGVAACYDRMGRFELSRRHYEMALAIAPRDPELLAALAASLDLQGEREEAAAVRREIAVRLAAAPTPAPVLVAPAPKAAALVPVSPAPVAVAASAPIAAPAQRPVPAPVAVPVRTRTIAAPSPSDTPAPQLAAAPIEAVAAGRDLPVEIAEVPAPAARIAMPSPQALPEPVVGQSVTIDLPPPRPADAVLAQAEAIPAPAPEAAPATAPEPTSAPEPEPAPAPVQSAAIKPDHGSGPRLERLSMGEIALITSGGPTWEARTVAETPRSTTVRFVPLREASANARPAKVRLLNAARVERLAARTRSWLTARGWSRMPIGDAPQARARSVILYPAAQRELAQTLANQFGFAMEERSDAKFVTMLLGRDAARIEELRPRNA